jgi:hypothetical protein
VCDFVDRQFDASVKAATDKEVRGLCSSLERFVTESEMGNQIEMKDCDPLIWELLLTWKRREREHKHFYMREIADAVRPREQDGR